jgi:hypothetical protein
MIRIRPKQMASKLSTYWPPGDILNFWPTLLRVASERLLPQNRPPYLKLWLERAAIPDDVIQTAMLRYIQAMKLAHVDPDVNSMDRACARVGFVLSPPAAQAAVFMIIGELTTGIYIAGVKDTTPMGENGIRDDVESLVWAAEQQVQSLDGLRQ